MTHKDFDADRYAAFLKEKAKEDLEVAEEMLARQRKGFVLFLAHTALQKTLAVILC
jgi:HEPN domain-containing protein